MPEETNPGNTSSEPPLSKDGPSLPGQLGTIATDPAQGIFGQKNFSGVFDQVVKTFTGKNMYETEKAEADFKLLQPQDIAGALAIAGLKPGVHQQNVRGDSVYHFHKNRFRFVDENDWLFVKGTQTEEIEKNATLTYLKDRTVVVGRDDDLSVKNLQTIFVVGPSTAQYVGKHEVTAPENFEWKQMDRSFSATATELKALDFEFKALALETYGAGAELKAVKGEAEGAHESAKGHEGKALAVKNQITPIEIVLINRGNLFVEISLITPIG